MRIPKKSTLLFSIAAALVWPSAALLAVAGINKWSFNATTCMPVGFYRRAPKPDHLKDGDMVYFCPSLHDQPGLPFTGFPSFQRSLPASDNPAMQEAIKGLWLEHSPGGQWHCADGLTPFAKIVAATAGQTVEITKQGVVANGKLLPGSQIVTSVEGMPVVHLPVGFKMTIPKGYFWDYAPGTFAFTSAYYGPEPTKNILGSITPALVIPGSQYWYTDKIQTERAK